MKPAGAPPKPMVASSPGRAEKLPTPGLARLLRGNGGSRSRGRASISRSSPMFVSKSKSIGRSSSVGRTLAAGEEGDPSSPKVTCIGQVRIRKKKKKSSKDSCKPNGSKSTACSQPNQQRTAPTRCRCLERATFCNLFPRKPKASKPWRWWALSFRFRRRSKYQQRTSNKKETDHATDAQPGVSTGETELDREDGVEENESEEEEAETKVFVSSATTIPPKNALLLMRCRSAPHNRSSALATARCSISPIPTTETPEGAASIKEEEEGGGDSCNGSSRDGGDQEVSCSSSRALVLTRCKSEPAKTAAGKMVVQEASYCFWNNNSSSRRRRFALDKEVEGPPPPPPLPLLHLH